MIVVDVARLGDRRAQAQWLRHGPPIRAAHCDRCDVHITTLSDARPLARADLAAFLLEHVHEPTIRDGRRIPAALLLTGCDAMNGDDELMWCEDCGRLVPYRHPHRPTARARVASVLLRGLLRARVVVERFRDAGKPHP